MTTMCNARRWPVASASAASHCPRAYTRQAQGPHSQHIRVHIIRTYRYRYPTNTPIKHLCIYKKQGAATPSCQESSCNLQIDTDSRQQGSSGCKLKAAPTFLLHRCRMGMASTLLGAAVACFLVLASSSSAAAEDVVASASGMRPLQFPYLVQKLSLYQQENPSTAIFVLPAQSGHGGSFGALSVIDQPLTAGVDVASAEVGRARGLAVFSDDLDVGKTGAPELVWTADINDPRPGGYGKGTISLRGYNQLATALREVSIVGGTGRFRLAQGWATVSTAYRNDTTRYSTQAWTFYVYLPPFTVQDFPLDLHQSS